MKMNKKICLKAMFILFMSEWSLLSAQNLRSITLDQLTIAGVEVSSGKKFRVSSPLLSFQVKKHDVIIRTNSIQVTCTADGIFANSVKSKVTFQNNSKDTIALNNIVPFGESKERTYITGLGNHPLSRTHLFIPK